MRSNIAKKQLILPTLFTLAICSSLAISAAGNEGNSENGANHFSAAGKIVLASCTLGGGICFGPLGAALGYFAVHGVDATLRYGVPPSRAGELLGSQTEVTTNCYNWYEGVLAKGDGRQHYDGGAERDYSEGRFKDYNAVSAAEYAQTTLEEATLAKFAHIYAALGLQRGSALLDAGCGSGVWMDYCRRRGVKVTGLTLSSAQAEVIRKKNELYRRNGELEMMVHVADYRNFNPEFLQQFDAITALGSSEHICSSLGAVAGVWGDSDTAESRCNATRIDLFKNFKKYLKKDGKVFVTILTVNPRHQWSAYDNFQAYLLSSTYGGYYSTWDAIKTKVVPDSGFTLSLEEDRTRDYHWSSVRDPEHFGHWSVRWRENAGWKLFSLVTDMVSDPFGPHRWAYYFSDTWMWQFGGYQKMPLSDEQVAHAPVQLKYFMLSATEKILLQ